ncbi:dTMP kinase [Chloroflexota bacterium]
MAIVVIEGLDGSGKTTQAKLLVQRLTNESVDAIYVRPVYIFVDLLLTITRGKIRIFLPSARRMKASRAGTLNKFIRGLLFIRTALVGILGYSYALLSYLVIAFHSNRGRLVVCDRYFYQFFFDLFGDRGENVMAMFPSTDLTFLLEGDLDALYPRMEPVSDMPSSCGYYEKAASFYRSIIRRRDLIRIDAGLDENTINDIIYGHVSKLISAKC